MNTLNLVVKSALLACFVFMLNEVQKEYLAMQEVSKKLQKQIDDINRERRVEMHRRCEK